MKIKDLEARIADRAHEEVNDDIIAFQKAIDKALTDLFGSGATGIDRFGSYGYAAAKPKAEIENAKLAALKLAIENSKPSLNGGRENLPWPAILWAAKEEKLRNDLLAKMDLIKLLITPKRKRDSSNDCQPQMKE